MIISLHHGDWRDVFASWPERCALIMDPPYGKGWRRTDSHPWNGSAKFTKRPCRSRTPAIRNDKSTAERNAALEQIPNRLAAVFGPHRLDLVPPWGKPRDVLFWDKGEGVGAGDTTLPWKPCVETIAVYGKGWKGHRSSAILRAGVIAYMAKNAPNGRKHPNQKPLSVMRELVAKTPPGTPIVDPFMGSGTTGVAAFLEGRDFYGAELELEWFEQAQLCLGESHGPLFAAVEGG